MPRPPPTFPAEIWLIIIKHLLRDRSSSQHLSRLARTCRAFHGEINHRMYETVVLKGKENATMLARTVQNYPHLKGLVKELRHGDWMAFSDLTSFADSFHAQLAGMRNLETLILRHKHPAKPKKDRSLTKVENQPTADRFFDPQVRDLYERVDRFLSESDGAGFSVGSAHHLIQAAFDHVGDSFDWWLERFEQRTALCHSRLGDFFSSLRVCHLGSDSAFDRIDRKMPNFNHRITTLLPQLRKLCITGSQFSDVHHPWNELPLPRNENMEELTLLNCKMRYGHFDKMLALASGLKRLTFRGPSFMLNSIIEEEGFEIIATSICDNLGSSLESLDIDVYWGVANGLRFGTELPRLRKLTVTTQTILGRLDNDQSVEAFFPESLEELVIRHEDGTHFPLASIYQTTQSGFLTKLHTVVVQMPHFIEVGSYLYQIVDRWKLGFQSQGIHLSAHPVLWPMTMHRYDGCSCENLSFYHRFPCHPKTMFR